MSPRRGLRFRHAHQRTLVAGVPCREWPLEQCIVTRVTAERVYFRNSTGFSSWVVRDRFAGIVVDDRG